MNNIIIKPSTRSFAAVVDILPGGDELTGHRCHLYSGSGTIQAWTWLDIARHHANRTHVGTVTFMPTDDPGRGLLVGFAATQESQLSRLLPFDLCPDAMVVINLVCMVDSMTIAPLQRFIVRALTDKDVLRSFWTCPASNNDHHAYPGGLAFHSYDVASRIYETQHMTPLDRDLGITYALLHDYGKIWWLDPERRDPNEHRNHERLGLDKLEPYLVGLDTECPDLGAIMRELLGGPRVHRDTPYPLAIKSVVRAFDQMSCEDTRPLFTALRERWDAPDPY